MKYLTYTQTTEKIEVTVKSFYLEKESSPIEEKYVHIYYISIENKGDKPIRIVRRRWYIKNAYNEVIEVSGDGVVGQRPLINPGDMYSYNSYSVIKTYSGSMSGFYEAENAEGLSVKINIPEFRLVSHLLN
jgi:ApaG protein